MSVRVDWYEPEQKNIAYFFEGRWTWEETFLAVDEAVRLLDSVDYPVNLIVDVRKTIFMAMINFEMLSKIANAATMNHPNTKNLFLLGGNHFLGVLFNIFSQLFPKASARYTRVETEEELEAYLRE